MKLPINETRKFLTNTLNNNIKYTIIQDENIDKASVCVCVGAGSINNPVEFQGLAHFLEHMLFLGSRKYPKENHFGQELEKNGGHSNAYTATYETVYYFSVNDNYLDKILDIFSRFFIDPLFDKSSVNREINAVHSEHQKNVTNNSWRFLQMVKNLSKKTSMINTFSTGNLETLDKPNIREEMIKFYNKYYCSSNLTVCIISPRKINETEQLFKNIFSNIPKKKCNNYISKDSVFYDNKGKEYQIIPLTDTNEINYVFETDLPFKFIKNQVLLVIDQVIENNYKDNIEMFLRNKKLIEGISCGSLEEGLFIISVSFNKNYHKDIKVTIQKIHNYMKYYLDNLNKLPWNKIYDYYVKKYLLLFDISEKTDELTLIDNIAVNMQYYDPEKYYSASKIITEKDEKLLHEYVNKIKFDNAFIIYITKEKLDDSEIMIDKYYNTEYLNLNKTLNKVKAKKFSFNFDTNNKYLSINPKIIEDLDKNTIPKMIDKNLWYGGISKFNEVSIKSNLILYNLNYFNSLENYLLTLLACNLLNYYLSNHFTKESEIGFNVIFNPNSIYSSINLIINGFNDKYDTFFYQVFEYLNKIKNENIIKEADIKIQLESILDNIKNLEKMNPWDYVNIKISEHVFNNSYNNIKMVNFIKKNKKTLYKNIIPYINNLLSFNNTSSNIVFFGNLKKNMIPDVSTFKKNLEMEKIPFQQINKITNMDLTMKNKDQKNNLVLFSFYCGNFEPYSSLLCTVISILLQEPAYDYLRTKKQLGYLVSTSVKKYMTDYYILIKVQSDKSLNMIEEIMNQFLELFKTMLNNDLLEKQELAKLKVTIKEMLLEKDSSLLQVYSKYINEIINRRFLFNKNQLMVNQLPKLNKPEIIKYFEKLLQTKKIIKIKST